MQGISLELKSGAKVALVGPSGGGKVRLIIYQNLSFPNNLCRVLCFTDYDCKLDREIL